MRIAMIQSDTRTGARAQRLLEAAATAPLPVHTKAVLEEARRLAGPSATAVVARSADGVKVRIELPEGADDRSVQAIAVRAQGAVRRIDPWLGVIDVQIGGR